MQTSRWWKLSVFFVMMLLTLASVPSHAATSDLSVGNYQLISSTRMTRTVFDYTYKANVTNLGVADMIGVTATLTSKSAKTVVVDGNVTFGEVLAGKAVASSDTFTIRQDRSVPLNPADLVRVISGEERVEVDPTVICTASKLVATGQTVNSILACHAKAAEKGVEADPACVDKAEDNFSAAFAKAEEEGRCQAYGGASGLLFTGNSFVSDVVKILRPTLDVSDCAANTLSITGTYVERLFHCMRGFFC